MFLAEVADKKMWKKFAKVLCRIEDVKVHYLITNAQFFSRALVLGPKFVID